MNTAAQGTPGDRRLSRLLRVGLAPGARPVDELIARLRREDGAAWFTRAIDSSPASACGPATARLLEGKATLEELRGVKEASKALLHQACDREPRLRCFVSYFLSVAAALVHHCTRITSRGDDLEGIFLDLAEAAPAPWADFLARAALGGAVTD